MTPTIQTRPHVILSTAMSVDGCLGDGSSRRLVLSSAEDLDAIDALRADCDAILVGAGTVRADNPRLVIRSDARRRGRIARNLPPDPMKATLTRAGDLDPRANFFAVGDAKKIVYCTRACEVGLRERIGRLATVVCAGPDAATGAADPGLVLADLAARGVGRVLIEGGQHINTLFLAAGLVDEWRLAMAPFFVGEKNAPRVVDLGRFPHDKDRRMIVEGVDVLGDIVVIRYRLTGRPCPDPVPR